MTGDRLTAVPMTSARLAAGNYEVIGTSRACLVMRTPIGWELVVDGETLTIFGTKREALSYCQEHSEL